MMQVEGNRPAEISPSEALLHQARVDTNAAHSIYLNNLSHFEETYSLNQRALALMYLDIASAQIAVGNDYQPMLDAADRAIALTTPTEERAGPLIVKKGLLEGMGDFEGAWEICERLEKKRFWKDFAVSECLRLGDSTPDDDMAHRALAKARRIADKEKEDPDEYMYASIAVVENKKGLDPRPSLLRAKQIVEGNHNNGWYSVSLAYAECGFFEEAYLLVPNITEDSSLQAVRSIADIQIAAGLFGEAREAGRQSQDPFTQAYVLAKAAIGEIQDGNTDVDLDSVIASIQEYEVGGEQGSTITILFSALGEAQARMGLDSSASFQKALQHCTVNYPNRYMDRYIGDICRVAETQARVDVDSSQALEIALREADAIVVSDENDYMGLDFVAKIMEFDKIGDTAINTGNYNFANRVLQWFNKNLEHSDYVGGPAFDMIQLLSHRAIAQVRESQRLQAA